MSHTKPLITPTPHSEKRLTGFLLTRHWHDTEQGVVIECWFSTDDGPLQVCVSEQESVFFIEQADTDRLSPLLGVQRGWRTKPLPLKSTENNAITALYFRSHKRAREAANTLRREISVWEADIRPAERFLMERFITGGVDLFGHIQSVKPHSGAPYSRVLNPVLQPSEYHPTLRVVSIDIETSMDAQTLFSIAVVRCCGVTDVESGKRVFLVADELNGAREETDDFTVVLCATESECITAFLEWVDEYDPDVLIGWNVVGFDMWVLHQLCKRLSIPFRLGRTRSVVSWRIDQEDRERRYITVPGRVVLDGIELLRTAFYNFDSFSLEFVANELLGAGKLIAGSHRGEDIAHYYQVDRRHLARYNIKDCELVGDIFDKTDLINFAIARTQMTGMLMDRSGGAVASFEFAYLPRMHRKGYVAPNLGELQSNIVSPGGYVLDSKPGLYENVLVLDFKSLYPSIIRTFAIDPYGFWFAKHNTLSESERVPGFNDACFAKNHHILPELIRSLWQKRDEAKHSQNASLSYAIKIIMNSFYGVLGSSGCRFFDPRIASSITLRGHQIIQQSKEWIEQQYTVVYGDTDSVFVLLGEEVTCTQAVVIGNDLAKGLNEWWRTRLEKEFDITSHLEIEFETHYRKFFMPTIRGSELGSKKRYAGISVSSKGEELIFRGLESVRSDWTPLAKKFQQSLYEKIFYEQPYKNYLKHQVESVFSGECDDLLVYKKRLRRQLYEYQRNIPPHVQAAKKLSEAGLKIRKGDWIEYVITTSGAEPLSLRKSPLDYQHYIDKQLAPVADSLLMFLGERFSELTDRQFGLF
ncbi:DNA polymerase II [Marinibactrum halimedae]|uniref:DNA polymerase n=1 Tax=Marinibactrum halimedae TaxID=1444977 RepID=A0AA37T2Z7_9GAMM|nr:DNA polymerase II [Marinibactrum halimedae]MCD9459948.1 DNA polymerase II [Marinibactrum halimedae]GLS25194.1 DNA polymerase [Marinibactrum halimedae]